MKDYVSIDLETTGFSADKDDIIEIGAWKVKQGVVVDKFTTLVRPIAYIPRTIQQLTGITMEDVKDCETVEPNIIELYDFCEDLPFLGHNLSFDFNFLQAKGKAVGLDFSLKRRRCGIDTLKLSKKYLNLENNKLETVASHFNIQLDAERGGYHRAGYDAYITKLIYDRFALLYPKCEGVSIPELIALDNKNYGKVVNNETLSFI